MGVVIFRENKTDSNPHVFISYSSKDNKIARELYKELENLGLDPWLSEIDTAAGANFAEVIPEMIENSLAVVILITKDSVKSDQVIREVNLSVSNKKHLIPVNMTGRPDILKSERAWEYYLGIVQMFEHEDTKSTALKIFQNIEFTTGKRFNVGISRQTTEVIKEEKPEPVTAPLMLVQDLPLSTENYQGSETKVVLQLDTENETKNVLPIELRIKQYLKQMKGIHLIALTVLLCLLGGLWMILVYEKSTVQMSLVQRTLNTSDLWVDKTYLETGYGNSFKIENRDSGVSGEYFGSFSSHGKKKDSTLAYISITVGKNGKFKGILTNEVPLNGYITLNSPNYNGKATITFENCLASLTSVEKEEFCTFYETGS